MISPALRLFRKALAMCLVIVLVAPIVVVGLPTLGLIKWLDPDCFGGLGKKG